MQIRARMSMSADGYVTTPSGWPALVADPSFVPGQSHGIAEFLANCEMALMGRVTFEPALSFTRSGRSTRSNWSFCRCCSVLACG